MRMVRDVAPVDRLPHLAKLGFDPDDAGRLAVAGDRAEQTGMYVDAESGASRFFDEGAPVPDGVWIAQREIDGLRPDGGAEASPGGHGFGEGWGRQGKQFGGDRSYPEEDSGGTRRVPHGGVAEDTDSYLDNSGG